MITEKINKRLCKVEHMDRKDCCLSLSQTILRNTLLPAKNYLRFSKGELVNLCILVTVDHIYITERGVTM